MGTSRSFGELAGKLDRIAVLLPERIAASFRQAERDLKPVFNGQAQAAAGGDRRLSGAPGRGVMNTVFETREGRDTVFLNIKPVGPWGIRDNTDVGGPTGLRVMIPKKAKRLKFEVDGETVFARRAQNVGPRGPFWGNAREQALPLVRRRIPPAIREAILAGIGSSGFASR